MLPMSNEIQRRKAKIEKINQQKITRRRFIKGGLAVGGTAAALAIAEGTGLIDLFPERQANNSEFIQEIEQVMGINQGMNRQEVVRFTYGQQLRIPGWLQSFRPSKKYTNDRRHEVVIGTDQVGEAFLYNPDVGRLPIDYPRPDKTQVTTIDQGQNRIKIYSGRSTINELERKGNLLENFSREYFSVSGASNTLHINLMPHNDQRVVQNFDIQHPVSGYKPSIDMGALAASFHYVPLDPGKPYQIFGNEILLNMSQIHSGARYFGISEKDAVEQSLTNEMVGLLSKQEHVITVNRRLSEMGVYSPDEAATIKRQLDPRNEAPSTLLGYLAGADEQWADIMLGGELHREFTFLLAGEMERLAAEVN